MSFIGGNAPVLRSELADILAKLEQAHAAQLPTITVPPGKKPEDPVTWADLITAIQGNVAEPLAHREIVDQCFPKAGQ